jgi:hypothetical protein
MNKVQKTKSVLTENAPLSTVIGVVRDGEIVAAVIRKLDGEGGLYALNTRDGSFEITGRDRIDVASADHAKGAVWCGEHGDWKMITPSGAVYCRACSRTYLKKWNADKKANGGTTAKTPEERQAEREARESARREAAAVERATRLTESMRLKKRTAAAHARAAFAEGGYDAARKVAIAYLTDEELTEALAGLEVSV